MPNKNIIETKQEVIEYFDYYTIQLDHLYLFLSLTVCDSFIYAQILFSGVIFFFVAIQASCSASAVQLNTCLLGVIVCTYNSKTNVIF